MIEYDTDLLHQQILISGPPARKNAQIIRSHKSKICSNEKKQLVRLKVSKDF